MSMDSFMGHLKVIQDDPELRKRRELAEAARGIREILQIYDKISLVNPEDNTRIEIEKEAEYGIVSRIVCTVRGFPFGEDHTLFSAIDGILNDGIRKIGHLLLPDELPYSHSKEFLLNQREIDTLYSFLPKVEIITKTRAED